MTYSELKRIDSKLINSFRDKVNESGWVLHLYNRISEVDKWSIICSAMDWINVSIDGIDLNKINRDNGLEASRQLILFVSCIDILFESVSQLHRVIFDTSERPFSDKDDIFQNKLFSAPDNKYFKTIRACFAAHPVDLEDPFTGGKKEKRYASWSGNFFGKGDFSVFLYSYEKNIPFIEMGISLRELMEFAFRFYTHLETIILEIDKQIHEHIEACRNIVIPKTDDPIDQINILYSELEKRLDNNYYRSELDSIIMLLEAPISNEKNKHVVEQYRKKLLSVIDEIYNNIQQMTYSDLFSLNDLEMRPPYNYDYIKFCEHVHGGGNSLFSEKSVVELFSKDLKGLVDFSDYYDCNELYMLIKAGLYMKYINKHFV